MQRLAEIRLPLFSSIGFDQL